MTERLLLLTLAFFALTATAFAAPAPDGTFRGRTSQGYATRVEYSNGQVQFVLLPWKAKRCTPRDGYFIKFPRFNARNDPDAPIEQSADGRSFHDSGRVVDGPRKRRAIIHARMSGHFVGDDKIVGTQSIRVRTHDRYGNHHCVAKMRWTAKRR